MCGMDVFAIIISSLIIVLIVLLIVLVVKVINTVDRANLLLDDLERKTKSLNGLFNVIDGVTDTLSVLSDTLVSSVTSVFGKLFTGKKKKKSVKEIEEDE